MGVLFFERTSQKREDKGKRRVGGGGGGGGGQGVVWNIFELFFWLKIMLKSYPQIDLILLIVSHHYE